MPKKSMEFTTEQLEKINALFAQDYGIQRVGKIMGIPKGYLKKPLRDFKRGENKLLPLDEQHKKLKNKKFLKELRQLFLDGKSVEKLTIQFCISTGFLEICYKNFNFTAEEKEIIRVNKSTKVPVSDFQKSEIIRLYNDGYGQPKLSKILGLDQWIIRKAIEELGLTGHVGFKEKLEITEELKETIKKLYDEGKGTPTIALHVKISKPVINKILKSLGYKLVRRKLGQKEIPTERKCRGKCQLILPIENFRQTFKNKHKHLIQYEYSCFACTQLYANKMNQKRRKNNIMNRIRDTVSHTITSKLKSNNTSKNGKSCIDYLPYTMNELKIHIELLFSHSENLTSDGKVWMNWENWGIYNPKTWNEMDPSTWIWQLDHKKPHCAFNYNSMEHPDFIECWSLNNLRPYSAKLNSIENARGFRKTKIV